MVITSLVFMEQNSDPEQVYLLFCVLINLCKNVKNKSNNLIMISIGGSKKEDRRTIANVENITHSDNITS